MKTAGARGKIRHYFKVKGFEQSVALGREMLDRELKRERIKEKGEKRLSDLAQATGIPTLTICSRRSAGATRRCAI